MATDEQRAKWRERTRLWRQANPDKNREVARKAMAKYLATPQGRDAAQASSKRWRDANPRYVAHPRVLLTAEEKRARRLRCQEERIHDPVARRARYDPVRESETARIYRETHREEQVATHRAWRAANPDKVRALKRRYNNKPEVRMRRRYNARLNRKGISQERHDAMLAQSGGTCWACGQPETRVDHQSGRVNPLSIDHDHACCPGDRACGECVRGLLCDECNRALGCMHDDPVRLMALMAYLAKGEVA